MKISIITATYNSGRTVRDTIESILSQTYSDIELIIKDGGSKDNTLEILQEYESKFEGRLKIISCPDKGIYDAMNQGIETATGDVIGILNSDDMFYDSHVISDIVYYFDEYEVDCIYGDLIFVKEDNVNKVVRKWIGSQYKDGFFVKGWAPSHPTFYVKKECYEKFGLYDISLNVSADFELMMRFLAKNKIKNKYVKRYFVKMRYGGESTSSFRNITEGNKNVRKAFDKNGIKMSKLYYFRRLLPKAFSLLINKLIPSYIINE